MIRFNRNSGVTLLELLIVIIIIGILGAIAAPRFLKTAENARVADATKSLGDIRSAILTVRGSDPTYNPGPAPGEADINSAVDANAAVSGNQNQIGSGTDNIIEFENPSAYWRYTYAPGLITATKNPGVLGPGGTIVMDLYTGMYDISESTYDDAANNGTLPEPTQA